MLWWSTTVLDQRPSISGIIEANIQRNIHFLSSVSNLEAIYPEAMCELINIYFINDLMDRISFR